MTIRIIKNKPNNNTDYRGPHYQLEYHACWSPRLNNPLLNKLYKESVCYSERWYLELRKLILDEQWVHPLIISMIGDRKLRTNIVKSTFIDGALMRSVINSAEYPEYHISAGINLKKINRWCAFFVSLPDSIEILADLNGQSHD